MWGIYEDGNSADGITYSWKYDNSPEWNSAENVTGPDSLLRLENDTSQAESPPRLRAYPTWALATY